MTMAASEVSVGLALVVYLHQRKHTVDADKYSEMSG
jgi:NADH:ubiquinone oxidoreductase subunit K